MPRVDKPVRALGTIDPRWTPENISGLTTAVGSDPRPGSATTESEQARLDPSVVGAQSQTVIVEVLQGGYPQLGGSSIGVGYYLEGEGVAQARGFQAPTFWSDYRSDADIQADTHDARDCCYDPLTGRVFALLGRELRSYSPYSDTLDAVSPPSGIDWSGIAVAYSQDGTAQLWLAGLDYVAVSRDHGASWTGLGTGTRECFAGSPSFYAESDAYSYRLVPDGYGSLLWLGIEDTGAGNGRLRLAASDDLGVSWTETQTPDPGAAVYFDASPHPEGWIALVVVTGITAISFYRLDSAFADPDDVEPVEIATPGVAHNGIYCACDTNGVIWVYLFTAGTVDAHYSTDRGLTWHAAADLNNGSRASQHPALRCCPAPGGGLAAAVIWGSSGTKAVGTLGGWSAPGRDGNDWASTTGARNDLDYIGWGAPDLQYGMTRGGSGGTETQGDGYWDIYSGVGPDTIWFEDQVYSGPRDQGASEGIIAIESATPGTQVYVEIEAVDAGSTHRTVQLKLSTTAAQLYDVIAGANVGSAIPIDGTLPTQYRISFNGDDVRAMIRQTPDTLWQQVSGTLDTDTAGTDGVYTRFGCLAIGPGPVRMKVWRANSRGTEARRLQGLGAGGVKPENANIGIGASLYPLPDAHDADRERAAYLRLRGGPSIPGETHTIPPSYGYPITASFPTIEPSPSRPWRSGDESVDMDCLVDLGIDSDIAASPAVALVVRNANVQHVDLIVMDDGGSAITVLATMQLARGFGSGDPPDDSVPYVRSGDRIMPGVGNVGGRYIRHNEAGLVGGVVRLDGTVYRVRAVKAGYWDSGAPQQAAIYLDGVDDGSTPASGDCQIIWHSACLVYYRAPGDTYRYWGWRVRAADTPTAGPAQIGCAYLVGLQVPGKQWSNAQDWTWSGNVRSITDEAGTERRKQLGPTRRTLSIVWDDGALQSRSIRRDNGVDADWLGPEGIPLVGRDDVAGQLSGLLEGARGGAYPVLVVLADAPSPEDGVSTRTITDQSLWFVGYVQEVRDTTSIVDANRSGGDAELVRNSIGTIVEAV